jgi:YegS/Rv2252/BmrU family lipid kinase
VEGRRVAAILNPVAGHGRAERRWRRAERDLIRHGVVPSTFRTSRQGEAASLARAVLEQGFDTVLAVGGDGTVHEVVNGLSSGGAIPPGVRLGVVPGGTGMDFARNAGLSRSPQAAVARVLRAQERRIDLGVAGPGARRLFVNFAETGIGAAVVARELQLHRSMPGRASFFVAALDAMRQQENIEAAISVDGVLVYDGPLVSVVVANGRYFGAGMKIAPRAEMDDGLMDVLVLGNFSRAELLAQIWKIYPGVHLGHAKVAWLRGRHVEVAPRAPTHLDLDGELFGPGPYTFSVLPGALPLLV